MPPKRLLPASVVADFERWIEMGVPDPRDETETKTAARIDIEAGRSHWAFQPFSKPMMPAVRNSTWVRTPIDAFVLAKMEKAGMDPAPEADRRVWLRRVYLDLIGLPPTPKEQSAFLSDHSAQAFEHVVDDLLSRPQYGERWARHWLDIARYGESIGYEADTQIPFAWRYRDYVIQAFNNDIPFDQFAIEQLAGDELPDFDSRTQIATTFLRLATYSNEGLLGQQNTLDDTLGMAIGAFLGLNIQCARCHDHKFEPLQQADYYGLMAVFGGVNTSGSPSRSETNGNGRKLPRPSRCGRRNTRRSTPATIRSVPRFCRVQRPCVPSSRSVSTRKRWENMWRRCRCPSTSERRDSSTSSTSSSKG